MVLYRCRENEWESGGLGTRKKRTRPTRISASDTLVYDLNVKRHETNDDWKHGNLHAFESSASVIISSLDGVVAITSV